MKLLCELTEEIETIVENVGDKKNVYISGIYMQAGIKNRNGRIYPPSVLENEVDRYVREEVNPRKAYGELDHPPTPKLELKNASHRIVELKQDGNNYIGKSLVLNTPMGDIVRGLIEGDCNIGVSSRGLGTLKKTGNIVEVQSDFRLVTGADIVSNPSAPDAFVTALMEGVDWVWNERNGWEALQLAEQVKDAVDHNKKMVTEEVRLKAFERFLHHVKNVDFGQ